MITSLVLKGMYNIEVDNNGNFYYREDTGAKGSKLKITDVPFVRYRFDKFGDEELQYISKMMEKFKYSIHMAEMQIHEDIDKEFQSLRDTFDNMAIYIYMNIDNQNVEMEDFTEEQKELMDKVVDITDTLDRFMLKDKSSTLYTVSANKLKYKASKILDIEENNIGVCSSPVSRFDNNKCLSAIQARELASLYAENDECALPTSNHECMECGGCIRYKVVKCNLELSKTKKKDSFDAMNKPVSDNKKEPKEPKKKLSKRGVVPFDTNELLNLKF